jgi:hypothetical protein
MTSMILQRVFYCVGVRSLFKGLRKVGAGEALREERAMGQLLEAAVDG